MEGAKMTTGLAFFFRLPGELRNRIYEDLLIVSQPISIYRRDMVLDAPANAYSHDELDADSQWPLSLRLLGLFLASRQMHAEASSVFFSQNCFTIPPVVDPCRRVRLHAPVETLLLLRYFLDCIGPRNGALLRHIRLPFTVTPVECITFGKASFHTSKDVAQRTSLLPTLYSRCPNLQSLEFHALSSVAFENHLCAYMDSPVASRVLAVFNAALHARFPLLDKVTISLNEDMLVVPWRKGRVSHASDRWWEPLRAQMRGYGWTVVDWGLEPDAAKNPGCESPMRPPPEPRPVASVPPIAGAKVAGTRQWRAGRAVWRMARPAVVLPATVVAHPVRVARTYSH
ncbi:hypothetical protein B0T26DRAFT_521465 [Lasiosphaeria miniovina]|uniref:Uncharacterized protein n=1 Tax=Lasiosphaeria miniovina TaxID=1954250 RepID=A0AA39ZUR8_9PEZI|nr:uncharacterized protein B0T26DRAFT_521465 [Lasiosphaeria miniovina]KAK0704038.1 hypothetical protein B0T26DRAFT_521465 [Lasiosphaeria miniovina]